MPDLREVERELDRIVDRLNSMPLAKAGTASDDVHTTATLLVQQTRRISGSSPTRVELPQLAPQGLGAMLAVTRSRLPGRGEGVQRPGRESPVLDALVSLRRALP